MMEEEETMDQVYEGYVARLVSTFLFASGTNRGVFFSFFDWF